MRLMRWAFWRQRLPEPSVVSDPIEVPATAVDLAEDVESTTTLLRDSSNWRTRVTEQVDIDKALSYRSTRTLQIAPLLETLTPHLTERRVKFSEVTIALPVATLPKGPLVNFDARGGSGEALLLMRAVTAERQCHFILRSASAIGVHADERVSGTIEAICAFTPGVWRKVRGSHRGWNAERRALSIYLRDGLGFPVSLAQVHELQRLAQKIGIYLQYALGERPDPESSADNVLLALPEMVKPGLVNSVDEARAILYALDAFVLDCVARDGYRTQALVSLGEYGRRWEALLHCTVPLNRPFTVGISQDRPLKIRYFGRVGIDIIHSDAWSNHLAVRVLDPDVQMQLREPKSPDGQSLNLNVFTSTRDSREDFAVYSSEDDRDYLVRFRFRLVLPRLARAAGLSFFLIAATAIGIAVLVRPLAADDLALIVVPSTIAAGLVLTQQRTSLTVRLNRFVRTMNLIAILTLWAIVAILVFTGRVRTG